MTTPCRFPDGARAACCEHEDGEANQRREFSIVYERATRTITQQRVRRDVARGSHQGSLDAASPQRHVRTNRWIHASGTTGT